MTHKLIKEFHHRYQKEPEAVFFSPGRVNLIGEHIDYNGGHVMPAALSSGTWLAVGRNLEKQFHFQSLDFPASASLHLQTGYSKTGSDWFNYPLGVLHEILQEGHPLSGLDLLFSGDLPVGAGLSSSASIEVVTVFAASELFGLGMSRQDIALLSKKAENEFMGISCGIMDPFTVVMGQKDKALLLDCDTLAFEYLPFETGELALVIINSNKQRSLADSKYNERFTECGAALEALQKKLPINHLCELDMASLELNEGLIPGPVLKKRARHVVSENARVRDAAMALQTRDWVIFGKLMYASHHSLREDYEVTGIELDTIVDFCRTYPGCTGARMTGAGFGGCVIALVKKISFDDFASKLIEHYTGIIGYEPGVFTAATGDGARRV